ncbi:MAG: substrate-binding domain-containing protein [Victivallaceae bacterium]|jgi:DNA-binding LacI/PurR family transcriptional regulator
MQAEMTSSKYLWKKVADELTNYIHKHNLRSGSKFFTADEISARYGISNITSRRVLSELSSKNLIEQSRGRACVIKQVNSLRKIYILIDNLDKDRSISFNYVYAGVYKGITEEAIKINCETELISTAFLKKMTIDHNTDIIIMQNFPAYDKTAADLLSYDPNINCVCCQTIDNPPGVSTVSGNLNRSGWMITGHLISRGHQRIAMVACGNPVWYTPKFDGYYAALKEHNMSFDAVLVKGIENNRDSCNQAMNELLALKDPPTAVFCSNDYTALWALNYCKDHNIPVPDKLAIAGFDNLPESRVAHPALTTIDTEWAEQGRRSVRFLAEHLERGNVKKIVIEPKLIIREST